MVNYAIIIKSLTLFIDYKLFKVAKFMFFFKKITIVVLSTFSFVSGCSVYSAMNAPDPVNYTKISIGQPRSKVIGIMGRPVYSDTINNYTTDNFEFIDGHHAGTKSRVLLYFAGDFFTLGLAEFVFWPLEELLLQGAKGKATVRYDDQSKVTAISVFSKGDEKPLYEQSLKEKDLTIDAE